MCIRDSVNGIWHKVGWGSLLFIVVVSCVLLAIVIVVNVFMARRPVSYTHLLLLFRENVPESAFTFTRMPQKARLRLLCANGPVGQGYTCLLYTSRCV